MVKLFEGEEKLLEVYPVNELYYKVGAHFYFNKKIIVTNKRLIIKSEGIIKGIIYGGGYERSIYYSKEDMKRDSSFFFPASSIKKYEYGRGAFLGDYIKIILNGFISMNIKLYTSKNKEIYNIIKKFKSPQTLKSSKQGLSL